MFMTLHIQSSALIPAFFIERFLFAWKGPQQLTQTAIGIIASIENFQCSFCTPVLGALLLYALKSKSCIQVHHVGLQ